MYCASPPRAVPHQVVTGHSSNSWRVSQMPTDDLLLLRLGEAARRLNVSTRQIQRWERAGVITRAVMPGLRRALRYRASDVAAVADGMKSAATDAAA